MSDGWYADWGWVTAFAALIFGMAIGWLAWGGRPRENGARRQPSLENQPADGDAAEAPAADAPAERDVAAEAHGNAPGAEPKSRDPALAAPKLAAIEREIKDARTLLEGGEEEIRAFGEDISALDGAIKRANGRLRLLARELRRAFGRGPDA